MAMKLPRATIEELEGLVDQLGKDDPRKREQAMLRLEDYERSGRVPLEALLEFSEAQQPSLSMYAIAALGRNGGPAAVKRLVELAERHRGGNVLFLETIVDALGETREAAAAPVLLSLLGIRTGWTGKLPWRRGRKAEEDEAEGGPDRERLALPVVRALEKIGDAGAAERLGDYLEHPDALVRWHTVQLLAKCNLGAFGARIKAMAEDDADELVREAAAIAADKLTPLPPNLNN